MADRGTRAKYVTSMWTGSRVPGAAGLVEGCRATSHWAARDALANFAAIPTDQRVVRDRNGITGVGLTAGLDLGLTPIGESRGQYHAESVHPPGDYDPQPPFHAGSTHTAPPEVRTAVAQMPAGFSANAEEPARSIASRS